MAMVGSGSLYRRTHCLSRLAWSWVGGRLAPFYIHQMNRVNTRNGSAMMTHHKHCFGYYIIIMAPFDIHVLYDFLLVCHCKYIYRPSSVSCHFRVI